MQASKSEKLVAFIFYLCSDLLFSVSHDLRDRILLHFIFFLFNNEQKFYDLYNVNTGTIGILIFFFFFFFFFLGFFLTVYDSAFELRYSSLILKQSLLIYLTMQKYVCCKVIRFTNQIMEVLLNLWLLIPLFNLVVVCLFTSSILQ